MSDSLDWQEGLSQDLWLLVFSWVSPREQLQIVNRISKKFRILLAKKPHWEQSAKTYLSFLNPSQNLDALLPLLEPRALHRFCLQLTELQGKSSLGMENCPSFYDHGNRLLARHIAMIVPTRGPSRACLATSTDNPQENLENVLPPHPNFRHIIQQRWWSSRPSEERTSDDTLLFLTDCRLALLTQVAIQPLLDPYIRHVIYSWSFLVVRAYRLPTTKAKPCSIENSIENKEFLVISTSVDKKMSPNSDEEGQEEEGVQEEQHGSHLGHGGDESTNGQAILDSVLHGEVPLWESERLPYSGPRIGRNQQEVRWQTVRFPPGIVANAVTLTLIGKNYRQFSTSGYYACVHQVKLDGAPFSV